MVDAGPVPLRREEAQRHTDADREDHRRESQLDGRRETVLELVGDRARTGDAGAEVAARERLQVRPVLDVDGLVEPVLMTDLCDGLRRGVLAQERLGG